MSWDNNNHFRQFAQSLEETLLGHEGSDEPHVVRQRRQVEALTSLEEEFRTALVADRRGGYVYTAFIQYVRDQRRNILAARPYFRERQDVFKTQISPALRERDVEALQKFHVNYEFVSFALKAGNFGPRTKVARLAKKIIKVRNELIEANIPLAISRAVVFFRYRQPHLEYMDFVQIANMGLIAAIDKFVGPYNKSFGAVLYGRITGDLVEGNSETLIHFYPSDKRKIYTANKLVKEGRTFEDIAGHINDEAETKVTDEAELQQLYTAAYVISGETTSESEDGAVIESQMAKFGADPSWQPDVRFEQAQLRSVLHKEISKLSLFEQKLLAMKGVVL
ncbi:putative RNA polymerase sigma factor [Myxococcus phage Mx1]|nr:putative RNA polymerase sigma factor [Myxococcus phage Mx1]